MMGPRIFLSSEKLLRDLNKTEKSEPWTGKTLTREMRRSIRQQQRRIWSSQLLPPGEAIPFVIIMRPFSDTHLKQVTEKYVE